MKSHSSKAPRKSFDVTKMSGPDIAAEMARHMAEFKSGRRPSDPAAGRQEATPSASQSKQSANHPFLRASLAAEGSPSLAPSRSRDDGFEADARAPLGSEGGKGLAFLRHGLRHDHWPEVIERSPVQYSRRRSSYRAGLLAGAGLTLIVVATASAALWKTGALPDFIEARLPAASLPAGPTDSEGAASTIASTGTIKAPSADFAQAAPTPPTPIVLMVAPAPPPTTNPTLAVDTLSAITAVQPDVPAVGLDDADSFQAVISDHRAAAPAVAPQQTAAPVAGHPADSLVTSPTLRALKQLSERPSLKPDLDVGQFTGPEAVTATTLGSDEVTVDQPQATPQQATPYVATAKPFTPVAASPLPSTGRSTAAARDPETSTSDSSTRQALSPLPPPIVIRSVGTVGGVAGAVSVEISEQPADGDQRAAGSLDQPSSHSRRDAGSESDTGRSGGLGVAGAQSDGPSASARGDDHGGNPGGGDSGGGTSGGGTDPGGDGGSGSDGGSGGDGSGGDGGDGSGGDGSGGDGSGGDGSGGDGSGGDGSGGDGSGGDGSGGDGSGGDGGDGGSDSGGGSGGGDGDGGDGGSGSDGGSGGAGDGGGGSDGGSGSDGGGGGGDSDGGDGGGDSDGGDGGGDSDGGDGGGDSDGGDGGGGDSDGGDGDGGDGAGGDDGASGGLGGALGGLGGALGGALGGLGGN